MSLKIHKEKVWLTSLLWVTTLWNCILWKQSRHTECKTGSGQSWLKTNKTPLGDCSELSGNIRTLVTGDSEALWSFLPSEDVLWDDSTQQLSVSGDLKRLSRWDSDYQWPAGFNSIPRGQACVVLEQTCVPPLSACKGFRLLATNWPQTITRFTLLGSFEV